MERSGGFAVIEMLIAALVIAIIVLGGYYVVKRNHQKTANNDTATSSTANTSPSPSPAKTSDPTKFKIPEFGILLINVPPSIQDLLYTYYPASTEANYTQAVFSTDSLYARSNNCSIGELDKYPGKYNAAHPQGTGNFVKQFKGFWIQELDVGVPCKGNQKVLDLQNAQINTFKQYATNPDNLQLIK